MSRWDVFGGEERRDRGTEVEMPDFDPAGPGTPEWRLDKLLEALEKRFPTSENEQLMMGPPPEDLYLQKIDELIEKAWMYDDLCK